MQHPANNPIDLARAISGFFTYGFDKIWAIGRGSHPTPPAPPGSHSHRRGHFNSRNHPGRRGDRYSRRASEHPANRMHGRSHQRASPCNVHWNRIPTAGDAMPRMIIPADVVSARPPLNTLPPADLSRRTEDERATVHSRPEGQGRLEEVKLEELPFYSHISNILLDSYLAPIFSFSKKFSFKISSKTARDIDEEGYQGTSMPVNITELCRLEQDCTNELKISSSKCRGETYVVFVSQMKKVPVCEVLDKIIARKPIRKMETQELVKARLKQDSEGDISTTTFQCSLQCPIGMTRMTLPCRASTCKHIQCFDALVYIRMNECKPTWICPVCNCPAHFSDLLIDGYFQDILQKDKSSAKIKFHSNGTWSPVPSSEPEETAPEVPKNIPVSKRKFSQVDEVVVIDLEEEDPFTRKDSRGKRRSSRISMSSVQIPVTIEPLAKRMRTRSTNRQSSQTNAPQVLSN
ncbi:E3 SUMO-protein ligase PIAS3-like [Penaeus indicus]|uniref:E3 SUMO-protein ligase PIAS3-like n=1 Tax=Penaeus indicus TaxID=29960 RepID=UPI00300C922F